MAGLAACDKKAPAGSAEEKAVPAEKQPAEAAPAPGGNAAGTVIAPGKVAAPGARVERTKDGRIVAEQGGNRAVVRPDGSVDAKAADGTQAEIREGAVRSKKGSVEAGKDGATKIEGPGGEKVVVGKDGSVQVGGIHVPAP